MTKTKIKIALRILLILSGFCVTFIFVFAKAHGSSFPAAVQRGVSRTLLAMTPKPQATFLLDVKFDKQDHSLSCEVASLKMGLAYRGILVDESDLIWKVGSLPMWGDPQKGFVGNINGKMLKDGYGVHWDPLARVANEYRSSSAFENWTEEDIIRELHEGNPVITWGYIGSGKPVSWKTPEGKEIQSVFYEHTFVVRGYAGPAENPTGYFVIDPIYGEIYQPKETFLKKWDAFGRSGMIVY